MSRADRARRERSSRRLSLRHRRPAGPAPSRSLLARVLRGPACLALAVLVLAIPLVSVDDARAETVSQSGGGATWRLVGPNVVEAGETYTYTLTRRSGSLPTNEYFGLHSRTHGASRTLWGTSSCSGSNYFCFTFTGTTSAAHAEFTISGVHFSGKILTSSSPHTVTLRVASGVADGTTINLGVVDNGGVPRGNPLQITVGDPPEIDDVSVTSTPTTDDGSGGKVYGAGEKIQVTVTFDEAMTVTGDPTFELRLGDTDGTPTSKQADYKSGSESTELVFEYTVESGDSDDNGIFIQANAVKLDSNDEIQDSEGNDADLSHSRGGTQSGHKVDGSKAFVPPDTTAPEVSSAAVDGDTLEITFNEDLAAAASLANNAFGVTKGPGNTVVALSSSQAPAIDGKTVTLTLASALTASDTNILVDYTKPTSGANNKLEDATGNEVASFTDEAVTNNTAGVCTETAPASAIWSACLTVRTVGGLIGYNSGPPVVGSLTDTDFTYRGTDYVIGNLGEIGSTFTQIRFDRVISNTFASEVTLHIGALSLPFRGTFSGVSARQWENVQGLSDGDSVLVYMTGDSTPPEVDSAEVTAAKPKELVLTFDEALATDSVPDKGQFTVKVGGTAEPAIKSVAINSGDATKVKLGLAVALDSSQTSVTVDYAKPSANPLKDATGNEVASFTSRAVDNNAPACPSGQSADAFWTACLTVGRGNTPHSLNVFGYHPRLNNLSSTSFRRKGTDHTIFDFTYLASASRLTLKFVFAPTTAANSWTLQVGQALYDLRDASVSNSRKNYDWTSGGRHLWTAANVGDKVSVSLRPDTMPPTVSSAEVDGDTLEINFNENLASASSLANDAFEVTKGPGDTEVALSDSVRPSVGRKVVTLTLASALKSSDTNIKVSYTKPASGMNNKLKDAQDNEVASFTDQAVTNTSPDTAPEVDSAEVTAAKPKELVLTFDEALATDSVPDKGQFTVKVGGTAEPAIKSVAIDSGDATKVRLGLAVALDSSQTSVTVDYAKPSTNPLKDAANNEVVAFTGQTVDNNAPACPTGQPGEAFWTACVTVGAIGSSNIYGFIASGIGALSDTQFTRGPNTYTIDQAYDVAGSFFRISFTSDPRPADWTLRIGSHDVILNDAAYNSGGHHFQWASTDILGSSNEGDKVSVSLRPDTTPEVDSAEVTAAKPKELVLTFDGALATDSVPDKGQFTVKVGGTAEPAIKSVAIDGSKVRLGLAVALDASQTGVTVDYTKPSASPLKDATGNEVVSFTGQTVTNNAPACPSGQPGDAFWTACLTLGWNTRIDTAGLFYFLSSTFGSLTDTQFVVDGNRHEIDQVNETGGHFSISFTSDPRPASEGWIFQFGSRSFPLSGKSAYSSSSHSYSFDVSTPAFSIHTFNWSSANEGDKISVSLRTDTAPPAVSSAAVDGDTLEITFNEDLAAAASLANNAFGVTKGSSNTVVALSSSQAPAIDGKTVTLTLASALTASDTNILVDYTKPTSGANNKLEDTTGNEVGSFTDRAVDNNTLPVVIAAEVTTAKPKELVLTFDDALATGSVPAVGQFTVKVGGTAEPTIRSVVIDAGDATKVRLGLAVALDASQANVTVDYAKPSSNPLKDADGNEVAAFTVRAVTNRAPACPAGQPAVAFWTACLTVGDVGSNVFGFMNADGDLSAKTFTRGGTAYTIDALGRGAGNVAISFAGDPRPASGSWILQVANHTYAVGAADDYAAGASTYTWNESGNANDWAAANVGDKVPVSLRSTDTTAPTLSTATVAGDTLTLTWDEPLKEGADPAPGDFTATVRGNRVAVSGVDVAGNRVTLTLADPVSHGWTVTLSYTPGTDPIMDPNGNVAGGLVNRAIENLTGESGLVIVPSGSVDVNEGGMATWTVALDGAPSATVTLAVASSDTGAATVTPSRLVFTSVNWRTPQLVTVTGVEDADEDDEQVTVTHTGSGVTSADVTVWVDDDEGAVCAVYPDYRWGYTVLEGKRFALSPRAWEDGPVQLLRRRADLVGGAAERGPAAVVALVRPGDAGVLGRAAQCRRAGGRVHSEVSFYVKLTGEDGSGGTETKGFRLGVIPDTGGPMLLAAYAKGTKVTLDFDETLKSGAPASTAFGVTVGGHRACGERRRCRGLGGDTDAGERGESRGRGAGELHEAGHVAAPGPRGQHGGVVHETARRCRGTSSAWRR